MYCAANACIEQVIQHGEVDVFQAVKTVRRHRPQLVENLVMHIIGFNCGNIFIADLFPCILTYYRVFRKNFVFSQFTATPPSPASL